MPLFLPQGLPTYFLQKFCQCSVLATVLNWALRSLWGRSRVCVLSSSFQSLIPFSYAARAPFFFRLLPCLQWGECSGVCPVLELSLFKRLVSSFPCCCLFFWPSRPLWQLENSFDSAPSHHSLPKIVDCFKLGKQFTGDFVLLSGLRSNKWI